MPGLDLENPSNGSSHLPSSASSSSSSSNSVSSAIGSPSQQTIRNRLPATSTEWNNNHTTTITTTTASLLPRQPASEGSCDSHVTTSSSSSGSGGGGGVRKFTWKELSLLHQRHNAHVAYRGKVSVCVSVIMCNIN